MMDEVLGRGNFVATIAWENSTLTTCPTCSVMVSNLFMKSPVLMPSIPDEEVLDNITTITASFDQTSKKHQIDVEFSETVSRLLAPSCGNLQPTAVDQEPTGNISAALGGSGEDGSGGDAVKKSGGSTISYAADHAYSMTVE
jgi:hypothetical protein